MGAGGQRQEPGLLWERRGGACGKGRSLGRRLGSEGREIGGPGKGRGAGSTEGRVQGRGRGLSGRGGAKATCACPGVASGEE